MQFFKTSLISIYGNKQTICKIRGSVNEDMHNGIYKLLENGKAVTLYEYANQRIQKPNTTFSFFLDAY
jgi:hypothetical protein